MVMVAAACVLVNVLLIVYHFKIVSKLQKLKRTEEEYAATAKEFKKVVGERDELKEKVSQQLEEINRLLTEKSSWGGSGSADADQEVATLRAQLKKAKKSYTELLEKKLESALSKSGDAASSEEYAQVVTTLKDQIKELRQQVKSNEQALASAEKNSRKEVELMTTAWTALASEYQMLLMRDQDRHASERPMAFLDKCRAQSQLSSFGL
eukprot:m.74425 g.74425  ORF g.74425 m.74425 type:complete len:209 (-) comp12395_c1_seq4:737-1363(-)